MSVVVDDNTAGDDAAVIDDVWCGCVSIGSQWAMGAVKLIRRALPSNPCARLLIGPSPFRSRDRWGLENEQPLTAYFRSFCAAFMPLYPE